MPLSPLRQMAQRGTPFGERNAYFAMFSMNRMRIAAVSARVALPCGSSMLLLLPLIRPSALAHCIASTAQDETLSTSLKLSSLLDLEVS